MSITLWEPIIEAIHGRLTSNLNTFIDTVNSEATSPSYPLEYPQAVYDYTPTLADLSAMPCIGISDGNITFEDDTGWGATGVATFSIVVFCQAQDQRELAWKLRRYAVAVTRCVLENRRLPPEGWSVNLVRVTAGPTLGRDETPRQWLSTVGLQVVVKWEQDT